MRKSTAEAGDGELEDGNDDAMITVRARDEREGGGRRLWGARLIEEKSRRANREREREREVQEMRIPTGRNRDEKRGKEKIARRSSIPLPLLSLLEGREKTRSSPLTCFLRQNGVPRRQRQRGCRGHAAQVVVNGREGRELPAISARGHGKGLWASFSAAALTEDHRAPPTRRKKREKHANEAGEKGSQLQSLLF